MVGENEASKVVLQLLGILGLGDEASRVVLDLLASGWVF